MFYRVSSGSSTRAWQSSDVPDTASLHSSDKQEEEAEEDTEELIQTDEPGSKGCWASCSRSVGSKSSKKSWSGVSHLLTIVQKKKKCIE